MTARAKTVAIMQPYFAPYAGYFRLIAGADLFVVYDCVQFPRRGWVHRNRFTDARGELEWLTLPLAKAPREAAIADLAFRTDAAQEMAAAMRRFPALAGSGPGAHGLLETAADLAGSPVDYIERLLARCCAALDLGWRTIRSSSLAIPPEVTGEARILAIVQAVGAERYVNAPGGLDLYDPQRFAQAGVELRFLTPYEGGYASILERLLQEPAEAVAEEIRRNLSFQP